MNQSLVGLIDADLLDNGTRHPNLALLKIAGYYVELGFEVHLISSYEEVININIYSKIFLSKVFTFTKVPSYIQNMINKGQIEYGGTGFFEDGGANLPREIEHHMPYYDLYKPYVEKQISLGHARSIYSDYLDYSIGFTTRGCFRKCEFCVNKKYKQAFLHSPIEEFLDKNRPYIYLWDDNILSYKGWEDIFNKLNHTGKPFQFRQGLDLRLMDDQKAFVINQSHYRNDVIFAFDDLKDERTIIKNLQIWKRHTNKICKLYILCAFESVDEIDIERTFKRIKILMKYGSLPYIMRFENYKNSRFKSLYIQIARWCNQPNIFKKMSFREFCLANQKYKSNKETNCSTLQSMIDFESEFPDLAKEYFDLKFYEENIFLTQYGYGRRYAHKPHCEFCKKNNLCWPELCSDNNKDDLLPKYFSKQIDLQCMVYPNADCAQYMSQCTRFLLKTIIYSEVSQIVLLLNKVGSKEIINKENTAPLSLNTNLVYHLIDILSKRGHAFYTLEEVLVHFNKENQVKIDLIKSICKLSCLLDLVLMYQESRTYRVRLSVLGAEFVKMSSNEKSILLNKLYLRIPYIQELCANDKVINLNNNNNFDFTEAISKHNKLAFCKKI